MKLHYYKDKTKEIKYFNTEVGIEIPDKYNEKPVRGFWVSTVLNIDLPIMEDAEAYKKELDQIVLVAKEFNMNTIYFQVRPTNDAFYQSKLNPYSRFLTGKEGLKPKFDVLEYLIKIAKKENIEIHAWANPYRVSMPLKVTKGEYLDSLDDMNYAKKHPQLVISDNNEQLIFNPASEQVKQFIIDSMIEIVQNYDVSGIHWDDYFYPYAPLSEKDNDLKEYEERKDKSLSLEDFRRFHVTDVIRRVHIALKEVNEKLSFGVSPFGIWLNKESDPRGANIDVSASESYKRQYADSYEWVKKGYIDYIVPQIYWQFGHPVAPFGDLVKWWAEVVEGTDVELYIGHAAYRLGNEGEFENKFEVVNQIKYANAYKEVAGNIFFTYKNFLNIEVDKEGMKEIKKLLRNYE